jgi:hypothetical protein
MALGQNVRRASAYRYFRVEPHWVSPDEVTAMPRLCCNGRALPAQAASGNSLATFLC